MILRNYQNIAVEKGVKALQGTSKGASIIVAPTGSGKSLIIAGIVKTINEPTLILQPTKEILEQNYEKLLSYGERDIGLYSASVGSRDIAKYTYATIGSIYKRPELFKHFKYVAIDECHLVNPKSFGKGKNSMYSSFFKAIGDPRIIALTASPYRLVNRYYYDDQDKEWYYTAQLQVLNRIHPFFFKQIVYNITNQAMFREGWLCPLEYISGKEIDIDISSLKANSTGADYDETQMENLLNAEENVSRVVKSVLYHSDAKKHNLIFCSSVAHANKVHHALLKMGESSAVISAETPKQTRENVLEYFRSGQIRNVCNVGVLTTGFDFPALDCIILARPTMSLALYYQMVGRGVRIDPDNPSKTCRVIDLTSNVARMGHIEHIRVTREPGGYKNQVETDKGIISGVPLFRFRVKNKTFVKQLRFYDDDEQS